MNLQSINQKIHEIRGIKVMLDFDIAAIYEVETSVLKQAVRRNSGRFPIDFMFPLNDKEIQELVSQFVIPSKSYLGGASPFAFTEQGIAMLSRVLKSEKAINMNIQIISAFVLVRQFALSHADLTEKLNNLELKNDQRFDDIYEAFNYLLHKDKKSISQENRERIGFK